MPGTIPDPDRHVTNTIRDHERRLTGSETQQSAVYTDPTRRSGDPVHNYAYFVVGPLAAVGLTGYGVAIYQSGAWHLLTNFTYP